MTAWAIDGEIYDCTIAETMDCIMAESARRGARAVIVSWDDEGDDAEITERKRGTFATLLAKLDPFQRAL